MRLTKFTGKGSLRFARIYRNPLPEQAGPPGHDRVCFFVSTIPCTRAYVFLLVVPWRSDKRATTVARR